MLKILTRAELKDEVAVVVGTRPGIIKFSPVIKKLEEFNIPFFIIHTGQHYSYNMDKQFFDDLELPEPRYTNDNVRKEVYHGAQTAEMVRGIESALLDSKPKIVIVGGDANTNLAGALATRKLGITLAHMEAGLRSNDWRMPEEHNRIMIDHISEILFAPTYVNETNLIEDNVKGKVIITGNTIVDAVQRNIQIARKKSDIIQSLSLSKRKCILVTVHREENVDSIENMEKFINALDYIANEQKQPIIFPMHPRTLKRLNQFNLHDVISKVEKIHIIDPVGYLDMLLLIDNASYICTDSGGIQEEACILRTPCLTLRDNTERPETVEVGSNKIVGFNRDKIEDAFQYFENMKNYEWEIPFGDGKASEIIVTHLRKNISL